jgi:hypothetical protein
MGMLLAITILVALLVDFLFLPPLLMFLDKNSNTSANKPEGIKLKQTAPEEAVYNNSASHKNDPQQTREPKSSIVEIS